MKRFRPNLTEAAAACQPLSTAESSSSKKQGVFTAAYMSEALDNVQIKKVDF